MPRQLAHYWALGVAAVILASVILFALRDVQQQNNGKLIYTLDDAYIHMAIARHVVEDGIWGITPHAFTANSSSLLWTGLIATLYVFTGAVEWAPFFLNLLLAFGLLGFVEWVFRRNNIPGYFRLILLVTLIFYIPLDMMIFMGMEHLLHALTTVVFVYVAAEVIGLRHPFQHPMTYALLITGLLLPATRYEGFFLVGVVGLILLLQRRWVLAISLGMMALAITGIFGLIAVSSGWQPIPVSILLKTLDEQSTLSSITSVGDILNFIVGAYYTLTPYPIYVQGFLLASLALAIIGIQQRNLYHPTAIMMILLGMGLLLHFRFISDQSVFNRYDLYLITLQISALGYAAGTFLPHRLNWSLLPLAILLIPAFFFTTGHLYVREEFLVTRYPIAKTSNEIYSQQYQMGRFVKMHYADEAIILNDIGAVSFLADIYLIDYFGLGTLEVAESRLQNANGMLDRATFNQLIAKYDPPIAIIYVDWFSQYVEGGVPSEWTHVGTWTITDTRVLGNGNVLIYAVKPEAVPELIANLQAMKDLLPRSVYQHGLYIEQLSEVND